MKNVLRPFNGSRPGGLFSSRSIYVLVLLFAMMNIGADCTVKIEHISLPQEFRDWVMYPTGSYWVYEDSLTGQRDSLVLQEQNITKSNGHPGSGYEAELLEQKFFSTLNTSVAGHSELYGTSPLLYCQSGPIGNFYAPWENLATGKVMHYYQDSLVQSGTTYHNLRVFVEDFGTGNPFRRSFWAHQIGLVRLERTSDSTVKKLLRYRINN